MMSKLDKLIQEMREQCFHMTDEEAAVVVDDYIKRYPWLTQERSREWLIRNV